MQQGLSVFLVIAIAATLFPIQNLFHSHDHEHEHSHETSHCDPENIALESDPCHISMYHASAAEHVCEHESHLTEAEEECELCKFLVVSRINGDLPPQNSKTFVASSSTLIAIYQTFKVFSHTGYSKGRAPPIS